MELSCNHITVRVTDLEQSKKFYIDLLNCKMINEADHFFAVVSGSTRISIFQGFKPSAEVSAPFVGVNLVFGTTDIEKTKQELLEKEVLLEHDIIQAGDFLKFFALKDPDGILIEIAEYL